MVPAFFQHKVRITHGIKPRAMGRNGFRNLKLLLPCAACLSLLSPAKAQAMPEDTLAKPKIEEVRAQDEKRGNSGNFLGGALGVLLVLGGLAAVIGMARNEFDDVGGEKALMNEAKKAVKEVSDKKR